MSAPRERLTTRLEFIGARTLAARCLLVSSDMLVMLLFDIDNLEIIIFKYLLGNIYLNKLKC